MTATAIDGADGHIVMAVLHADFLHPDFVSFSAGSGRRTATTTQPSTASATTTHVARYANATAGEAEV